MRAAGGSSERRTGRAAGADRPEFRKFGNCNAEMRGFTSGVVTVYSNSIKPGTVRSSDWSSGVARERVEEQRESRKDGH